MGSEMCIRDRMLNFRANRITRCMSNNRSASCILVVADWANQMLVLGVDRDVLRSQFLACLVGIIATCDRV